MKVRKTLIAVAVAALIPLGATSVAGDYGSKEKGAGAGADFKKLVANKDGRISQAEAAVDSTIVFSTADANGDGYLDSAEWKASHKGSSDQQQSMPSTSEPATTEPSTTEQGTPPAEPSSPDTETPRQ